MSPAAMMHVRVGSPLLTARFGSEKLPTKQAKRDEVPEIICEMNDKKAKVTVLNDENAGILVTFTRTNSLELSYDEVDQNIDFDAHIGLLYAGDLPSGVNICSSTMHGLVRGR